MPYYPAKVVDIVRCAQRDELFVQEMQNSVQTLIDSISKRTSHRIRHWASNGVNFWYYLLTSFSGLQTIGEEYTGTLRLNNSNKIPTRILHMIWLILHLGGDPIFQRLLNALQRECRTNTKLTAEAKSHFLNILEYISENKERLKRIHQSLFYIYGKYYYISNRFAGIHYVLLRKWMEDETFTNSFRVLGQISLFYTIFDCIQRFRTSVVNGAKPNNDMEEITQIDEALISKKYCPLCTEILQNPSATQCGHVFCWDCIFDSLNYQDKCPICRFEIRPNRIVFLQNYS